MLACQAKVIGPATIAFDDVPQVAKRSGVVTGMTTLAPDIVEVVVTLASPLEMRPGQYLSVKFSGFPARDLSPTVRQDGTAGPGELVFHIRRYPGGLVSTQIGATIRLGHRVQVRGPVRQRVPARGPWPADPDRRRHRLGADLGARRRRAARAAPSRHGGDRRQPRGAKASTCAVRSNG